MQCITLHYIPQKGRQRRHFVVRGGILCNVNSLCKTMLLFVMLSRLDFRDWKVCVYGPRSLKKIYTDRRRKIIKSVWSLIFLLSFFVTGRNASYIRIGFCRQWWGCRQNFPLQSCEKVLWRKQSVICTACKAEFNYHRSILSLTSHLKSPYRYLYSWAYNETCKWEGN